MGAGPVRLMESVGYFKSSAFGGPLASSRGGGEWERGRGGDLDVTHSPTLPISPSSTQGVEVTSPAMPFTAQDEHFMKEALAFARIAFAEREVPIGAVVVREGKMIGRGRNRREALA